MGEGIEHPKPWRIEYKIVITDPPQSEALRSNCVRLTVNRVLVDAHGMSIKREKVRDPETISNWRGVKYAKADAVQRGRTIQQADQVARGVRPTEQVHFRQ